MSGFQQRLKRLERAAAFDLARLYSPYRPAIEGLDRSFGRDRVRLRLFSYGALVGGDVVRDFAQAIGVPVPPLRAEPPRTNESLGAEAIAVLYARLRYGLALDLRQPAAAAEARRLVEVLRGLGSRRLTLAPRPWRDALERHRDDLAWTEARLGHVLSEATEPDAVVVATEDDLLRLAADAAGHEATRAFDEGLDALRVAQATAARSRTQPLGRSGSGAKASRKKPSGKADATER